MLSDVLYLGETFIPTFCFAVVHYPMFGHSLPTVLLLFRYHCLYMPSYVEYICLLQFVIIYRTHNCSMQNAFLESQAFDNVR